MRVETGALGCLQITKGRKLLQGIRKKSGATGENPLEG